MEATAGRLWSMAAALGVIAALLLGGPAGYPLWSALLLGLLLIPLAALTASLLWPAAPVGAAEPMAPQDPSAGWMPAPVMGTAMSSAGSAGASLPPLATLAGDPVTSVALATPEEPKRTAKPQPSKTAKPKTGRGTTSRLAGRGPAGADTRTAPRKGRNPAAKAPPKDDLKRITGIGPKLEQALNAAGITSFAQIAGWSDEDIARLDADLSLRGRIARDDWTGQARALMPDAGTDDTEDTSGGGSAT